MEMLYSVGASVCTFYGLQPRMFTPDRFYKMYALRDSVCGAFLARQIYDETSAQTQLIVPSSLFAPLAAIWAKRILRKLHEREARYVDIEPGSSAFYREDARNIVVDRGVTRRRGTVIRHLEGVRQGVAKRYFVG